MSGWLAAFSWQSTLILALTWVVTRAFADTPARTRESIWCAALVGCLVVPTVQTLVVGFQPFWSVTLPAALSVRASGSPTTLTDSAANAGVAWVGVVWAAIAAALMLRHAVRLRRFDRALVRRCVEDDAAARRSLEELRRRADLRAAPTLTVSATLRSPIALGFGRRAEICLPERALTELESDQLRALLAHEIAHLMRRDPFRLWLLNGLKAVMWIQPLVYVAVREIRRATEEQCDAWAAGRLDPVVMASCLTEVARWGLPAEPRLPAVGMAGGRSQLGKRVDRLLDGASEPAGRGIALAALLTVAISPWLMPEAVRAGVAEVPAAAFESEPPTLESRGVTRQTDTLEPAVAGEHDAPREVAAGLEHESEAEHGADGEHAPASPGRDAPEHESPGRDREHDR